jgi:hypothetical protein
MRPVTSIATGRSVLRDIDLERAGVVCFINWEDVPVRSMARGLGAEGEDFIIGTFWEDMW